ncbi:hypothetical protein N0V86_001253 [Didymella sp. IMI 355093]|nr:hypothetical protein N0V86_001253 [Didymella sp. IMI 355093]
MAGFIQNMIWSSVEGFVDAAKKTGGEYAGNALIKAGDAIENGGRSVGGGLEKAATGYGSKLSGQTYQASSASKALPSTARKPAVKRSNSMPANTKPSGSLTGGRTIAGPTSNVPIGAKKTVGGAKKAVGGVAGGATRTVGGVTNTATKTVGGVTNGATRGVTGVTKTAGGAVGGVGKTAGGVVGGASRNATRGVNGLGDGLAGLTGGATKSVGGLAGGASRATGGLVNNATQGVGGIVNGASKPISGLGANAQKAIPQGQPKPYDSTTAGSSYTNPYPTAKKAPVRPGQSKPFTPPPASKSEPKPYPGTNTLPGQGSKTPVKRSYKPAPTLGSQVQPGQKMTHIGAF